MQTFEEAKARRDALEERVREAMVALGSIPGMGSGKMGLTPDSVRATPEYQQAKRAYSLAADELRSFNQVFTKRWRAELTAERMNRRLAGKL